MSVGECILIYVYIETLKQMNTFGRLSNHYDGYTPTYRIR